MRKKKHKKQKIISNYKFVFFFFVCFLFFVVLFTVNIRLKQFLQYKSPLIIATALKLTIFLLKNKKFKKKNKFKKYFQIIFL
jgi:cytosine/uracil/thiamine/allantoin permease